MTKRILALLLAALMLVPMLAACGEDKPSTDTTDTTTPTTSNEDTSDTTDTTVQEDTPEDTSDFIPDGLETVDYNGTEFWMFADDTGETLYADEITSDEIVSSLYEGRMQVQNRFNCDIKMLYVHNLEIETFIDNVVATGDSTYSLCISDDREVLRMRDRGNNYNISNIKQFDFNDPWWTDSTTALAIGDSRRVGSSFLSYGCYIGTEVFMVNKSVAEAYHVEIPYEKVFAGDWYLDDLIEMVSLVRDDANGDGNWTVDDVYGWADGFHHLHTLQTSLGIDSVIKDADNNPIFNPDITERAHTYMEKLTALMDNTIMFSDAGYMYLDTEIPGSLGMVATGNALLSFDKIEDVLKIINMADFSFGYLIAPKFDETQTDYITGGMDTLWCIPLSAIESDERVDFIGTIIEALQCQNYNRVIPAFTNTLLKFRMAESPDDSKILSMIPGTIKISLDWAFAYETCNLLNHSAPGEIASFLKRQEKQIGTKLKKMIKTEERAEK